MTNIPIAANLDAYFCENCSYIEITTDPIELIPGVEMFCPHCQQDGLILLDKEQYSQNFNPEAFSYPQNILLKTFFENINDREKLFTLFAAEQPLLACSEQIKDLTTIVSFKFILYPTLRATCKVTDTQEITQISDSPIMSLIEILESS